MMGQFQFTGVPPEVVAAIAAVLAVVCEGPVALRSVTPVAPGPNTWALAGRLAQQGRRLNGR